MGKFVHGFARRKAQTAEYKTWGKVVARCTNPKSKDWYLYGGRGITICDKWRHSFPEFLADVGPKPFASAQLDRINNDGNYEPGNVRWATATQQQRNKRDNRRITANGVTRTLVEWCELTGFSHKLIHRRLDRGWIPEQAVSLPPMPPHRPFKSAERCHKI